MLPGAGEMTLHSAITALERACTEMGTQLFTITTHDLEQGLFRRIHSSHPVEYPLHGTKPLARDAWYEHCVLRGEPFIANEPEDFSKLFFDHVLITSMGLGSAANLPLVDEDGTVPGTVNLLAERGHFTTARLDAYGGLVSRFCSAILPHIRFHSRGRREG
ncbi:MAG: GAF domain-containing protein [Paracoccaceae bacterium]